MHWGCYERWPDQRAFARHYFQSALTRVERIPFWALSFALPDVLVVVNGVRPVREARVHLALSGTCIRVPIGSWSAWISDLTSACEGLSTLEREALSESWSQLQQRLPDEAAVIDAVDWETLDRRRDDWDEQRRVWAELQAIERRAELDLHNEECVRMHEAGAVCPHCSAPSNFRYVDRRPDDRSYFICRACNRSFVPITIRLKGQS